MPDQKTTHNLCQEHNCMKNFCSSSQTVKFNSIRVIILIIENIGWRLHLLDVMNTFLCNQGFIRTEEGEKRRFLGAGGWACWLKRHCMVLKITLSVVGKNWFGSISTKLGMINIYTWKVCWDLFMVYGDQILI